MSARTKVLLLASLLFLPFLGSRDMWAPDEPRYAQVAQEMVADGHWWHPHRNGREYRDKPPLYFWAEAVISLPFGRVNHWTARLPSVACGLLVVFLLFDLGRRLPLPDGNPEIAATAASLAFATCWLGAWMTRRVNLDIPLAATATAAVWAAWRAQEAAASGRRVWGWCALAGACTALGTMLKGPVVLLPVVGASLALMIHREFRKERGKGHALLGTLAGFGGLVAVLLAWLVPAITIGGYDLLGTFDQHVVDRASKGLHHIRPPWYYLKQVPADYLPWTLLAIPALWSLLKKGARRTASDWLVLGWALLPFLVLSIVVEKRNVYFVPALAGLALLTGRWLARLPEGEPNGRALKLAGGFATGLLSLIAVAALVVAAGWTRFDFVEDIAYLEGVRLAVVGVALAAAGGALVLVAGLFKRRGPVAAAWAFAIAFGTLELAVFAALPLADPIKSAREAGEVIAVETRGQPAAIWPLFRSAYVYYSGRTFEEISEREQLEDWLAEQPRPAWVLTYEEHLGDAPPDGEEEPLVVWQGPVGSRTPTLLKYER